ncbi:LysR family transcriptional regulator [Acuticoccus sediminis]|nr:LysR substrate-binding domain-containing protein [Acuticoccus sediminis]
MDIRQLRYFVAVVERGSFSAAARHLSVAQPALSRHVRALEEGLGVLLVRRDAHGVRPTEHGERLFHQASSILRQFDMVPEIVGGPQGLVTGRVVVGLPTSTNAVLARPLIRTVMARLPGVRLHVIESLSGYLQEWIEAGRLDISLLYDPRPNPAVELDTIMSEALFLVGPAHVAGDRPEGVPFKELERLPLAMPGPTHALRRLIDRVALDVGITPNVVVEVDSLGVMKAITEKEGLYSILPTGPVYEEVQEGRLSIRRLLEPDVTRSISMATSALRGRTRACEEVGRLIIEIVQDMIREGIWQGANAPEAADAADPASPPSRPGPGLQSLGSGRM